jgi:hypothetical protein
MDKLSGQTRTYYDDLKKHGARWINELPCVLWANRTSLSHITGEMPFFTIYKIEVILP